MKILLALIALAATTGNAQAQSRTLYDASGKVVGRSSTDSSGTVTNYDSRGRVISRETMTGDTTTVYDAGGRSVRFTRVAKALLPWRQRTNVWREVTSPHEAKCESVEPYLSSRMDDAGRQYIRSN